MTTEGLKFIKENCKTMTAHEMAAHLNHSSEGIKYWIKILGVKAKLGKRGPRGPREPKEFPKIKIVRPPAVYDNWKSHYGIAAELHYKTA